VPRKHGTPEAKAAERDRWARRRNERDYIERRRAQRHSFAGVVTRLRYTDRKALERLDQQVLEGMENL
jgi:hypothetical protein